MNAVTKEAVTGDEKDPTKRTRDDTDEWKTLSAAERQGLDEFIRQLRDLPLRFGIDMYQIADSSARADVECHCPWTYLRESDDTSTRWYDTGHIDPEDAAHIEQALRYLRARGRINTHPTRPELVNFVGVPE